MMYRPSLTLRPNLSFKKPTISSGFGKKHTRQEIKPAESWADKQITVTVVAYNERESLLTLLEKLTQEKDNRAGVLVVDNGLDDDIKKKVRKYPIHYIEASSNLGCSEGRNLAAAYTETPLISFLDADADIEEGYIEACLSSISDPNTVCARGRVLPLSKNVYTPSTYDLGDKSFPHHPNAEGISVWRTKPFKEAGGFEADLYGGEGVVLCYRMIELYGFSMDQFIYYPDLVLHHDYNDDRKHLEAKMIRNTTNRWSLDRKYPLLSSMVEEYNMGRDKLGQPRSRPVSSQDKSVVSSARRKFNEGLESYVESRLSSAQNSKKADKNKYKFTVVIPCYNLGKFVTESVKSVMKQTLDDVQIIVVDDVSTDGVTREVLESLSDSVTVIYRKENGGASAARNTGIEAAKSDYILCLDSDDTISSTYLEEAYNLLEMNSSIGVVSAHTEIVGFRNGTWRPKDSIGIPEALTSSPIPNASCYRKKVWEDVGGYDEAMRGYEDWDFWIGVLEKGWPIRVIPRQHYIYMTRPESKVKTSNKNAAKIVSHIVDRHYETFAKHMTYVIANTHKKYVDIRSKNMEIEKLTDHHSTQEDHTGLLRVARKINTLAQKIKSGKIKELPGLIRKNMSIIKDRIRR